MNLIKIELTNKTLSLLEELQLSLNLLDPLPRERMFVSLYQSTRSLGGVNLRDTDMNSFTGSDIFRLTSLNDGINPYILALEFNNPYIVNRRRTIESGTGIPNEVFTNKIHVPLSLKDGDNDDLVGTRVILGSGSRVVLENEVYIGV